MAPGPGTPSLPIKSLRDQVKALPLESLTTLALDIAGAVHAMQIRGVVHCDLKLDNVIQDLELDQPKVGRVAIAGLDRVLIRSDGHPANIAYDTSKLLGGNNSPKQEAHAATTAMLAMPAHVVQALLSRVTRADLPARLGVHSEHERLAPEVLDALQAGSVADASRQSDSSDMPIPFGKQPSWSLGVLLHELAADGQHPYGPDYPTKLPDGALVEHRRVQAAVSSYSGPLAGHELMSERPEWYQAVVRGLLQGDPDRRMSLLDAIRSLRKGPSQARKLKLLEFQSDHVRSEQMSKIKPRTCLLYRNTVRTMRLPTRATLLSMVARRDDIGWYGRAVPSHTLWACRQGKPESIVPDAERRALSTAKRRFFTTSNDPADSRTKPPNESSHRLLGAREARDAALRRAQTFEAGGSSLAAQWRFRIRANMCRGQQHGTLKQLNVSSGTAGPNVTAEAQARLDLMQSLLQQRSGAIYSGTLRRLRATRVSVFRCRRSRKWFPGRDMVQNQRVLDTIRTARPNAHDEKPSLVRACGVLALHATGGCPDPSALIRKANMQCSLLNAMIPLLQSKSCWGKQLAAAALSVAASATRCTRRGQRVPRWRVSAMPFLMQQLSTDEAGITANIAVAISHSYTLFPEIRREVHAAGPLRILAKLLQSASTDQVVAALQLASGIANHRAQYLVLAGMMPHLLRLIGSASLRVGGTCACVIARMCKGATDAMRPALIQDELIAGLVKLLTSPNSIAKSNASTALARICQLSTAGLTAVARSGAIKQLVALLAARQELRTYEKAIHTLQSLSEGSHTIRQTMIEAGTAPCLEQLLIKEPKLATESIRDVLWRLS